MLNDGTISLRPELLDLESDSLREAYHLVKELTIHKAKKIEYYSYIQ